MYPPPAYLTYPFVPLVGIRRAIPEVESAPAANPPALAAPQIVMPAVATFLPNWGEVWLAHLPVAPYPPGGTPPAPPGPPILDHHGRSYFPRVPDNADMRRLTRLTDMLSLSLNAVVGLGQLQNAGTTRCRIVSGGFEAARPPTVDDDSRIGATPGCSWVDKTAGQVYMNVRNDIGSAVWQQIVGGTSGGGGSGLTGSFP